LLWDGREREDDDDSSQQPTRVTRWQVEVAAHICCKRVTRRVQYGRLATLSSTSSDFSSRCPWECQAARGGGIDPSVKGIRGEFWIQYGKEKKGERSPRAFSITRESNSFSLELNDDDDDGAEDRNLALSFLLATLDCRVFKIRWRKNSLSSFIAYPSGSLCHFV
jgi:hypothetical protein